MTVRAIQAQAVDRKAGMTLGELSDFVIDAQHLGIPSDSKVEVRVGFRSQIQELKAAGEAEEIS